MVNLTAEKWETSTTDKSWAMCYAISTRHYSRGSGGMCMQKLLVPRTAALIHIHKNTTWETNHIKHSDIDQYKPFVFKRDPLMAARHYSQVYPDGMENICGLKSLSHILCLCHLTQWCDSHGKMNHIYEPEPSMFPVKLTAIYYFYILPAQSSSCCLASFGESASGMSTALAASSFLFCQSYGWSLDSTALKV